MGRIVNTFQLIEQAKGNINSRYDIWPKNIEEIQQNVALFLRKYNPQVQHLQGFGNFSKSAPHCTVKCANIVAWTRNKKFTPI